MTLIEDEFDEERVVISRLEQLGFSPSDGRKIFGTYQTMLTADEVQRRRILRRMGHYGVVSGIPQRR
jgi:hypothetical protein